MKKIVIPLCLTALAAGYAWADTAPTETGRDNRAAARGFKSLDLNNDGMITKQEAASNAKLAKDFDKHDTDRDGNLSFGEYAHYEGSVETNLKGTETPLEKKSKGSSTPAPTTPKLNHGINRHIWRGAPDNRSATPI